jgi:hypothetical protein
VPRIALLRQGNVTRVWESLVWPSREDLAATEQKKAPAGRPTLGFDWTS